MRLLLLLALLAASGLCCYRGPECQKQEEEMREIMRIHVERIQEEESKRWHQMMSDDDKLLSVQVVMREADSAASSGWATKKSHRILFRGNGEITDEGIDNAFSQGRAFRKRYVNSGFIDKRFLPSQIHITSSSIPRMLMSASSFGAGLFGRTPTGHYIVPPIHSVDGTEIFSCDDHCRNHSMMEMLLKLDYNCNPVLHMTTRVEGYFSKEAQLRRALNAEWHEQNLPSECSKVPAETVEAIVAELSQSKIRMSRDVKKCAKGHAKQFMFKVVNNMASDFQWHAGMLVKELANNMVEASNCTSKAVHTACSELPKMRLYYTDDVLLSSISQIFKVSDHYQGKYPEFSSAIVFEVRENDMGHYLKIFHKNGHREGFVDTESWKGPIARVIDHTKKFARDYRYCTELPDYFYRPQHQLID